MNPVRLCVVGCVLAALALAVPAIAEEAQPEKVSGLIDDPQKADVLIEYMHVPIEELPLPKGYVRPSRTSPSSPSGPAFPPPGGNPLRHHKLAARMWLVRVTNRGSCAAKLGLNWHAGLGTNASGAGNWGLQKDGKPFPGKYADAHPVHYLVGRDNEKRLARSVTPEHWRELVELWWGPSAKGAEPPKPPDGVVWGPEGNVEMAALWPGSTTWGYIGFAPTSFRSAPASASPRIKVEIQARWRREVGMFSEAELRCDLGKGVTWAFVENAKLAEQIIRDDPRTKTTAVPQQQKSDRRR